jgi:hypothetical protein
MGLDKALKCAVILAWEELTDPQPEKRVAVMP